MPRPLPLRTRISLKSSIATRPRKNTTRSVVTLSSKARTSGSLMGRESSRSTSDCGGGGSVRHNVFSASAFRTGKYLRNGACTFKNADCSSELPTPIGIGLTPYCRRKRGSGEAEPRRCGPSRAQAHFGSQHRIGTHKSACGRGPLIDRSQIDLVKRRPRNHACSLAPIRLLRGTYARPILYAEGSMAAGYVEQREGGYYIVGTRVSLDSVVYAFLRGESPEGIVESFPALSLEQVF